MTITRGTIVLMVFFGLGARAQSLLMDPAPSPAMTAPPVSLQILSASQLEEIKALGNKSLADQIKIVKSKVELELLSSTRPHPTTYFDSLGPAKRSVEQVTDVEGLYGKAVCPGMVRGKRILIVQDAPPSTLLHEFIHFLQMGDEKRWCELDGRVLEGDEKHERALLYHRFEFEALKTLWDLGERKFITFEDKAILIEGLNRENEILKGAGIKALDEDEARQLAERLEELKSRISVATWLGRTSDDAGSVLQKMEILNLKACVEQGSETDEGKRINECLKKRCSLSGFSCQPVAAGELEEYGADLYSRIIFAWVKPYKEETCPLARLKNEIVTNPEEPTPCWKNWYTGRSKKKKNLDLTKTSIQTQKTAWRVPGLPIDSKIAFYLADNPSSFVHNAYCYFIFQKVARFDTLPIDQFPYAAQGAAMSTDKLESYGRWLQETGEGRDCAKLVKVFSGEEPSARKNLGGGKKYVLILNPVAGLGGGLEKYQKTMAVDFNHERLHLMFADDKRLKDRIKKSWEALSESQQREFKKAHSSYNFDDEETLMREYFSYKYQDNPGADPSRL